MSALNIDLWSAFNLSIYNSGFPSASSIISSPRTLAILSHFPLARSVLPSTSNAGTLIHCPLTLISTVSLGVVICCAGSLGTHTRRRRAVRFGITVFEPQQQLLKGGPVVP